MYYEDNTTIWKDIIAYIQMYYCFVESHNKSYQNFYAHLGGRIHGH